MIADVWGMGARGPLGLSALQVAMGVRARSFEPRSVHLLDKRGREVGMGVTGGLGVHAYGFDRLVMLAAPALAEAVAQLPASRRPSRDRPLPVILCLAEPGRPDDEPRIEDELAAAIAERADLPLDLERTALVRKGQASFTQALVLAKHLLDGGAPAVAVGGVDSYFHPGVVRWLDEGYRLQTLDAEDGFIPSEAAAFLVLGRGKAAERLGAVVDVANGEEPHFDDPDEPNIARATTDIVVEVTSRAGMPSWTIVDINGERQRQREWAMASHRVVPAGSHETRWVWDTGDVGAASGPLFATIALAHCRLGCAPADRALLALHSEGPDRGVVVLEGSARD
jgi:3-oxoacyl-[acyl-carrier-protein] synthase-1